MRGRRCEWSPGSSWSSGLLGCFRAGNAGRVGVLANGSPRGRRRCHGDGKHFLNPDRKLPAARQLCPGPAGAGISLVATQALEAPALIRVAGAAAAPVQVSREVVRALHIHIHLFCRRNGNGWSSSMARPLASHPPAWALTLIRVGALGGKAGADAVYPDSFHSQLFQLPLEVPLLPLQLLDLVQGPALLVLQLLRGQHGTLSSGIPSEPLGIPGTLSPRIPLEPHRGHVTLSPRFPQNHSAFLAPGAPRFPWNHSAFLAQTTPVQPPPAPEGLLSSLCTPTLPVIPAQNQLSPSHPCMMSVFSQLPQPHPSSPPIIPAQSSAPPIIPSRCQCSPSYLRPT